MSVGECSHRAQRGTHMATASTTILDTVSAGAVPCHTDEETAIVAKVCRPPILRVGHESSQVLLQLLVVELPEGFGIVEILAQRVRHVRLLLEQFGAKAIGPPVLVVTATASNIGGPHG